MNPNRKRLLIVVGIGAAALILALALGEEVRETIIAPILYVVWVISGLIGSFPQAIFWAVFLTIALFAAIRSFHVTLRLRLPATRGIASDVTQGRVMVLSRRVRETAISDYARRRLARHLLDLTLQTKGYRMRMGTAATLQLLRSGRLCLPAEVQAYLEDGLLSDSDHRWGIVDRLRMLIQEIFSHNLDDVSHNPYLIELIQHLEEELEI